MTSRVQVKGNEKDIYEQFRPHSGIRYHLSQTETNFDGGITKVHIKQTRVEYEPGQDLTTPPSSSLQVKTKYAKQRNRGPVWRFREEIEDQKWQAKSKILKELMMKKLQKQTRIRKQAGTTMHKELLRNIGPKWYHILSNKQMNSADQLKYSLVIDNKHGTIINTVEVMDSLGIVLRTNHTKVEYAIKKYHKCPVEFLLALFKWNRPKDGSREYTLNDRIMLSCVVHLSMRETLKELHLRTPSPTRPVKPEKKKVSTKQRSIKYPSPYLTPFEYIPQYHKKGVYKNRHKEYASSIYFNYVDDMYDVYYEEYIKPSKWNLSQLMRKSKYAQPPKIPVRQLKSKIVRVKKFRLKSPSPYISPCTIKPIIVKPVEPVEIKPKIPEKTYLIDTEINMDQLCNCSGFFDEDTNFMLSIKITTSNEEIELEQRLYPFKEKGNVGELVLKDYKTLDNDSRTSCSCDEDETPTVKKIEYRCECCNCKKQVNISDTDLRKVCKCNVKQLVQDNVQKFTQEPYDYTWENSETEIASEENIRNYLENWVLPEMLETEEMEEKVELYKCTCNKKISTNSVDSYDPFALCTCGQPDKPKRQRQIPRRPETAIIKNTVKVCTCTKPPKNPIPEEEPVIDVQKEKKPVEFKETVEHITEPVKTPDEECRCLLLFEDFLDSHDTCINLFEEYVGKMKDDTDNYLKDIDANRCNCGDSGVFETTAKTVAEKIVNEELEGESNDSCNCGKTISEHICTCVSAKDICTCGQDCGDQRCTCGDDDDQRCTCGDDDFQKDDDYQKCTCDKATGISQHEMFQCKCEDLEDRIEKQFEEVKELRQSITSEESSEETLETEDVESEETPESVDSRIFVLDEFPKTTEAQMALLKKLLAALAEDGYPLAKLPNCHKLPQFKLWLAKRSRQYTSMEERENMIVRSKMYWEHTKLCCRQVSMPKLGIKPRKMRQMTWRDAWKHKKLINSVLTNFHRAVKQGYISEGQEMFPSTFHDELPTKNFLDCYFAYLPSDENQIFVTRPWQPYEVKDRSKRVSCM